MNAVHRLPARSILTMLAVLCGACVLRSDPAAELRGDPSSAPGDETTAGGDVATGDALTGDSLIGDPAAGDAATPGIVATDLTLTSGPLIPGSDEYAFSVTVRNDLAVTVDIFSLDATSDRGTATSMSTSPEDLEPIPAGETRTFTMLLIFAPLLTSGEQITVELLVVGRTGEDLVWTTTESPVYAVMTP